RAPQKILGPAHATRHRRASRRRRRRSRARGAAGGGDVAPAENVSRNRYQMAGDGARPPGSDGVLAGHVNTTQKQRQTGGSFWVTLPRRRFLAAGLGFPLLAALLDAPPPADAADLPRLGPPEPFDFGKVKETARGLAAAPYVDHPPRYRDLLEAVDYDAVNKIRFPHEAALWPPRTAPS